MNRVTERRRHLLELLKKNNRPLSTRYLTQFFGVTKPIIDNDIRCLRYLGYTIVGVPGHDGGYQLYDYKGSSYMVLDSVRAKRFEGICENLSSDDELLLRYIMHLAELQNIT